MKMNVSIHPNLPELLLLRKKIKEKKSETESLKASVINNYLGDFFFFNEENWTSLALM
jgi:hypothetical protein